MMPTEWIDNHVVGTVMVLAALAWASVPVRRQRAHGRMGRERSAPRR